MKLSVNLNKVALLRNSRGAQNPSPLVAARTCIDAGCHGITVHWREDERHTRADDVRALRSLCKERDVEFNLEGDLRPALLELAEEVMPDQITLVPVTPGEITSDHGWDLPKEHSTLAPTIQRMKSLGMRTSIFMDPIPANMEQAANTGADRMELYTEPYAAACSRGDGKHERRKLLDCCNKAKELGMGVNAGHDLDLRNLPPLAREVPGIDEVSIGHALIADALYLGLHETIARYLQAVNGKDVQIPVTQ